jgi:heterodisulfide reductase subunit A-like polyferredoxin
MRSFGVVTLRVASSLMVDDEARAQESAKDSLRLENRKGRRHLRRQRDAHFVLVSKPFVGDGLARLSQAFQVAPDGIPSHLPGFAQRSPVGNQPRQ